MKDISQYAQFSQVRIWPIMGLQAIQNNKGGPWRLWVLARALDGAGSGVILRKDLQEFTKALGVPAGTFRRWLASAKHLGLLVQKTRRNGDIILLMLCAEKTAEKIGCDTVGSRRVEMPAVMLVDNDWRGSVWAAFISTLGGRPVSRRTMRSITGVPERTQQDYEKQAGIKVKVNYAHDESTPADHLPGVREHERPYAFSWFDRKLDKSIVVWRCPDTRKAPMMYVFAGRGRSRKVNNTLSSSCLICNHPPNYSSNTRRAGDGVVIRLFHNNHRGAEKSWKRYAKLDIPAYSDIAISEMFVKKTGGRGCQQWSVNH